GIVAQQLLRDMDNKTIAALIDPFGSRAMSLVTEYWTIAERNTLPIPFEGLLLWNRLLWLGVALVLSGYCFWHFSFSEFAAERVGKLRRAQADQPPVQAEVSKPRASPSIPQGERRGSLRHLPH